MFRDDEYVLCNDWINSSTLCETVSFQVEFDVFAYDARLVVPIKDNRLFADWGPKVELCIIATFFTYPNGLWLMVDLFSITSLWYLVRGGIPSLKAPPPCEAQDILHTADKSC